MAWILLLVAGLLEIGWAIGLKSNPGWTRFWPSVAAVGSAVASFVLLAQTLKSLPVGTAYAVWAGIGVIGVAVTGILILGESATPSRLLFIGMICAGIIGLKLVHT